MPYYLYILRCSDGTFYTGSTNNIEKRVRAHNGLATGAKYTRSRRPVVLIYSESFPTMNEAKKREAVIKALSRKEKELLIQK